MFDDVALALDAPGTATAVRQYNRTSGGSVFPPPLTELLKNLVPDARVTSTGGHSVARHRLLVTITGADGLQAVMPVVTVADEAPAQTAAFSTIDNLSTIRDHLGLSVTQVAELFGVTRKAVYDWYEGAEPRPAAAARIHALASVISSAPTRNELQRLKTVWKVPVSGRSFLSVLNDDGIEQSELPGVLSNKLDELSSRLMAPVQAIPQTRVELGRAHLADYERDADHG